ncbi:MFS transporter [Mycetocola tolaasinivorans]|uniref:MFS transporter n=1 Tax=Mycetocola tolaasinivorans TaxID=76635 RepID=UPI001FE78A14|nr:MFS transporter [Mycetocola tolaasinivorans]
MSVSPSPAQDSLFSRRFLSVTLGACALVFLGAFESMAVTTIMPVISADLNGQSLYALAFAGPLATGVIGMVTAGNWADRSGPTRPLLAAVTVFTIGLIASGLATAMFPFLLGRLAQGMGGGAITVALYVMVARALPPRLHPPMFACFSAAWVLPSLVGPVIAGFIADTWSWHWVFLGVVVLVVFAMALVTPTLRRLSTTEHTRLGADGSVPERAAWDIPRILWATLAAVSVLTLSLAGEQGTGGLIIAVIALVIGLIAVRPLLPAGVLGLRRGLPGVIRMRAVVAATFFGAEIYVPYLLIEHYDFSPTAAGFALTGGAVSWAVGSALQGRLGDRLPNAVIARSAPIIAFISIAALFVVALLHLSPWLALGAWTLAGLGVGMLYPRLGVLTLAHSTPTNQGFNSAALTIADSFGSAISLAIAGTLFTSMLIGGVGPFLLVFAFTAVLALAALAISSRMLGGLPARAETAHTEPITVAAADPHTGPITLISAEEVAVHTGTITIVAPTHPDETPAETRDQGTPDA